MDARSILRAQDASRQNLVERDFRRRAVLTNTYTGALTTTDWRVNGLADQKPVIDVGWTVPAESLNPRVDFWSNANLIASKMKAVLRSQVTGIDSRGPTPTAAASALISAEARTHQPVFAQKPQILNGRSTTGALGLPSAKMAILSLADPRVPETLPFLQSIVDQLIAKYQAVLNSSSSVLHASREMQALAVQLGCSKEIALRASRAITRSYFPGQDIESKEEREEADRAKQDASRVEADEQQAASTTVQFNADQQMKKEAAANAAVTEEEKQTKFQEGIDYYRETYQDVVRVWAAAKAKAFGTGEGEIGAPPESYKTEDNIMFAYYMLHSGKFWFTGTPLQKIRATVSKLKVLLGYFDETDTIGGDAWKVRKDRQTHLDAFIENVVGILKIEAEALKANNNRITVAEPGAEASEKDVNSFIFHHEALQPERVESLRDMMDVDATAAVVTASTAASSSDETLETTAMAEEGTPTTAIKPTMAQKGKTQTPDGSRVAPKKEEKAARKRREQNLAAADREVARIEAAQKAQQAEAAAAEMDVQEDGENEGMQTGGGHIKKSAKRRKLKGGANEDTAPQVPAATTAETATEMAPQAAKATKETAETSTSTDTPAPVVFQSTDASTTIATPLPVDPVAPPAEDPAGKVPNIGQAPVVQKKKVQSKLPQGTVTTAPRTSRDTYTPGTDVPRPLVPPTQWTAAQKAKAPKTELERRLA